MTSPWRAEELFCSAVQQRHENIVFAFSQTAGRRNGLHASGKCSNILSQALKLWGAPRDFKAVLLPCNVGAAPCYIRELICWSLTSAWTMPQSDAKEPRGPFVWSRSQSFDYQASLLRFPTRSATTGISHLTSLDIVVHADSRLLHFCF